MTWLVERVGSTAGARLEVTGRPGDAEALAAGAGRAGHDRVVAIGGDGTVEVVNGLLDASEPPSLGIVPLGSGNDLARSLGLPDAVPAAWEVAVGDDTRSPGRRPRAQRRSDGALVASAGGIGFDARSRRRWSVAWAGRPGRQGICSPR